MSRTQFDALATIHGLDPKYHQAGAYERFHDYLVDALEDTIATALLTIKDGDDFCINTAARKRARIYLWEDN